MQRFTFENLVELAESLDATNPKVTANWRELYYAYKDGEKEAMTLGYVGVGISSYADSVLTIAYNNQNKESDL
tara:strand:+ start:692 stop:910 length:219 start_codon:yes stop_codon:yes gene_type:complete